MRRASVAVRRASLAALALFATLAGAQQPELSVTDTKGRMGRLGLIGKAERIVHKGELYLLVRLGAQDVRTVELPGGRVDSVRGGFLPMQVACDAVVLEADGARHPPLPLSLCREPVKISAPFPVPLYFVFRYPKPGRVVVTFPITVLPPEAPVARHRNASTGPVLSDGDARRLGPQEFELQVLVDDPFRKPGR